MSQDSSARTKTALILVCVATCLLAWSSAGEAPVIVCGSSHIRDIVSALEGNPPFRLHTLVPPTMCPSHFDVKPSDISALGEASCVLLHDWQASMPAVRSVIEAARTPAARVHVIAAPGNWLVPAVQAEAVKAVAAMLAEAQPGGAAEFQAKADARVKAVSQAGAEVSDRLKSAGCLGTKVVCHDKLTGFLTWAGFVVVSEYGQDGQLSAARMRDVVRKGQEAGIALVVDNAQGGGLRTGAAIARDTGAAHVILSNFPGGFSGVDTWEETLRNNVDILARAAGRRAKK